MYYRLDIIHIIAFIEEKRQEKSILILYISLYICCNKFSQNVNITLILNFQYLYVSVCTLYFCLLKISIQIRLAVSKFNALMSKKKCLKKLHDILIICTWYVIIFCEQYRNWITRLKRLESVIVYSVAISVTYQYIYSKFERYDFFLSHIAFADS